MLHSMISMNMFSTDTFIMSNSILINKYAKMRLLDEIIRQINNKDMTIIVAWSDMRRGLSRASEDQTIFNA